MSRIHFQKRRAFLRGAAALTASGAASSFVPQLSLMGSALAQGAPTGYKALVCIYLSGGNDSWNLLIPGDDTTNIPVEGRSPRSGFNPTPYGWYVTSRGGLHDGNASALGLIKPGGSDPGTQFLPPALGILGNQYGLNPAVPELQSLFNSGRLAFLANVGPLVEPLRRSTFNSFRRPPQLYSHNDQTSLWQIGGVPVRRFRKAGVDAWRALSWGRHLPAAWRRAFRLQVRHAFWWVSIPMPPCCHRSACPPVLQRPPPHSITTTRGIPQARNGARSCKACWISPIRRR